MEIETTNHTPGPWRIVEDRSPSSLEIFAGKTAICECWRKADILAEMANARLIAAAPDMLDALIACHEAMEYMSEYDIPITLPDQVKAAILKATGN
jgi:hypothetical protein